MAGEEQNAGMGFDLSMIGDMMATMGQHQAKAAASAKAVAEAAERERNAIAQSATLYQQQAQQVQAQLGNIEKARIESEQLANGGLLDRIELIGAQMLNPRDYTREGRQNRVAEASQTLSVLGQTHNANLAASEARIAQVQAQQSVDLLGSETALNALKVKVDTMSLMRQGAQESETLRLMQLDKLDLTTLHSSMALPPATPNGEIEIGGFKYNNLELQERAKSLKTRQDLAMWSPQVTDPAYAASVQAKHNLMFNTMSSAELQAVKANGGIMPDGLPVDPAQLEAASQLKMKQEQDTMQLTLSQAMAPLQAPQMLADAQNQIEVLTMTAAPNTVLGRALADYRIQVGLASKMIGNAGTVGGELVLMDSLTKANERLDAAVSQEAKARASGDADLEPILRNQMLGIPVDAGAVQDYVAKRFVKKQGFARALPNGQAVELQGIIDGHYSKLRMASIGDIMGDSIPDSELREQAARIGLEEYSVQMANRNANDATRIMMEAPQFQANPIKAAGITAAGLSDIGQRATTIARNNIAQQQGVDPNVWEAIRLQKPESVGLSPARADELAQMVNMEAIMVEYDLLDATRPGLGSAYATWIAENAQALGTVANSRHGTTSNLFAAATQEQLGALAGYWSIADESSTRRGQAVIQESLTRAKDPSRMFRSVLETVTELTPEQKEAVYSQIMLPVINNAKQAKLSPEDTFANLNAALDAGSPTDPALTIAAQRTLRALPSAIASYESILRAMADTEPPQSSFNKTMNMAADDMSQVVPLNFVAPIGRGIVNSGVGAAIRRTTGGMFDRSVEAQARTAAKAGFGSADDARRLLETPGFAAAYEAAQRELAGNK